MHTRTQVRARICNLSLQASQAYFWTNTRSWLLFAWDRTVKPTYTYASANSQDQQPECGLRGGCVEARQTLSMQFCTHSRISIKNKSQNVTHNTQYSNAIQAGSQPERPRKIASERMSAEEHELGSCVYNQDTLYCTHRTHQAAPI